MLDTETKRRIDTARDILVGKVPDPKSQVEQITIALIYKFMDDMDLEAEELGGTPAFFTGDYEKYGWRKIFDPALGGHEMLGLYGDAITRMALNPNLPQLFRDIFKNAYLPYRDPETLKSFLKIIDDFSYDHSEKLGDAFEYLLSVLGSQGDAGQFRTPRHIIDFMTALLDPKKNETIMDPACGTAGFLISAYKHILKENSSNYDPAQDRHAFDLHGIKLDELTVGAGKRYKGDHLTPDDRNRLTGNVKGYDISPDMVRLSLVNLYLHGFPAPHVYEYDTLTSDERWNEFCDVILANPPFMSPKGGIRPHKRFSVTSNRSEVLFVDYMAEHLTTNGRAAIVVPEGVIFQSGTAYKSLRKMLVDENYLVGVISLPAGVFNPYSGVKTSILWLDKALAKKTRNVLFAKIDADGFDLGAQRRPIKQNDLPRIFRQLTAYKTAIANGQTPDFDNEPNLSIVDKELIGEKGEYNLSGERYILTKVHSTVFELVELENIFEEIKNGVNVEQKDDEGKYLVTRIQTISDGNVNLKATKYTDDEVAQDKFMVEGDILLSHINSYDHLAKTAIFKGNTNKGVIHGINLIKLRPNRIKVVPEYAISVLKSSQFIDKAKTFAQKAVNQASIKTSDLKLIKIPLPPLSIQEEIVAEIESYQKIIDGARQVVTHYKPRIAIDPDWEMVALGDVCEVKSGGTPSREKPEYWSGNIPWVKTGEINYERIKSTEEKISDLGLKNSSANLVPAETVLMAMYGQGITRGKVAILGIEASLNQACAAFLIKDCSQLENNYLFRILQSNYEELRFISDARGGNQSNLSATVIKQFKIPLPPLETQRQIVAQIEREQALVKANTELISLFEQKIKARIAKVWGE